MEAGLLLATVLAATVLLLCLLPAHARAETTCRLAELTRADVELFQHTRGEDVVPRRCNARKELVSWTPADAGVDGGLEDCGPVTVCGRKWRRVKASGGGFLVAPADVRVVELPGEAEDAPLVPELPVSTTSCFEVAVGDQGADLYVSDPTKGPRAFVAGVKRLEAGRVLGACADVGDGLLAVHDTKIEGVVPASQVASTCGTRDARYFVEAGPLCREPLWSARTRRAARIYGVGSSARGQHLGAGESVIITGLLRGAQGRYEWAVVGYAGERGVIPWAALDLGATVDLVEPPVPVRECLETGYLAMTTCPVVFTVEPVGEGGETEPRTFPVPTNRPLLAVEPAGGRVRLADLSGTVDKPECLYRAAGSELALRFDLASIATQVQRDQCPGEVVAVRAPTLLTPGWDQGVDVELEEIPYLLRIAPKGDSLLAVAPSLFPRPRPTLADLAFAMANGVSDRVVKALVLGADAVRTPLQRSLDQAWSGPRPPASGPPAWLQRAAVEDPDDVLAGALSVKEIDAAHALRAAQALEVMSLSVVARELALDAIAGLAPDSAAGAQALGLYARTARRSGTSPRATELLLPWCQSASGTPREACRLGAQAALDDDRVEPAAVLVARLVQLGPQTARQHAAVGTWRAATGDLAGAATAYAAAAAAARGECAECSELSATLGLQIARVALAAEDADAAHDALARLPGPLLAANLELVLQTLASTGRYDRAFEVLQSVRWGLAGERPRPRLLLWGSHVLERSCRYEAAVQLQELLARQLDALQRDYDALRTEVAGPTPALLFAALEPVLASPEVADVVHSSAVERVLRCGDTCSRWHESRRQLDAFDDVLVEGGLEIPESLRRNLAFTLDRDARACVHSFTTARQRLADEIADLRRQTEFLELDRDSHLSGELELAAQVLDRLEVLTTQRITEDRAANERGWSAAAAELSASLGPLPEGRNRDPELSAACGQRAGGLGDGEIEGHTLVNLEVRRATACVLAAVDAGLSTSALTLLARYLPALALARRADFEGPVPLQIADLVPAFDGDSETVAESCCVATRPRLAELMGR